MLGKSILFGVVGWYTAAQFIKLTGIAEPKTKLSNVGLFGVGIPISIGFAIVPKFLDIPPRQAFSFVTLATATALILDGLATVLVPSLYTYEQKTPIESLSVIAYGAGIGIFAAYYFTKAESYFI